MSSGLGLQDATLLVGQMLGPRVSVGACQAQGNP